VVGVVDDAVDLLERAPPLGYQLHRLLIPVVHPPLRVQCGGELAGARG